MIKKYWREGLRGTGPNMAHSFSSGNMGMQVCADGKLHVARPLRSDPVDSRKTRYCYAIRLRVTSFIWSGPHWGTRAGRSCFLIAIPSSPFPLQMNILVETEEYAGQSAWPTTASNCRGWTTKNTDCLSFRGWILNLNSPEINFWITFFSTLYLYYSSLF